MQQCLMYMKHASHPGNIYFELKNKTAGPDPSLVFTVGHWTCCWWGIEQSVPIGVGAECFGESMERPCRGTSIPPCQMLGIAQGDPRCARHGSGSPVGFSPTPLDRLTRIKQVGGQDAYRISPTRKQQARLSASLRCPAPASPLPHPSAAALHPIPQPGTPADPAILLLVSFFSYLKGERKADTSRAAPDSSTPLQGGQGRPRTLARDAGGQSSAAHPPREPGRARGAGEPLAARTPVRRRGPGSPLAGPK